MILSKFYCLCSLYSSISNCNFKCTDITISSRTIICSPIAHLTRTRNSSIVASFINRGWFNCCQIWKDVQCIGSTCSQVGETRFDGGSYLHRARDRRRENRLSVWSRRLCCGYSAKLSSLVSALRFFHAIPITLAPSCFCCTQPRPHVPYTCTCV